MFKWKRQRLTVGLQVIQNLKSIFPHMVFKTKRDLFSLVKNKEWFYSESFFNIDIGYIFICIRSIRERILERLEKTGGLLFWMACIKIFFSKNSVTNHAYGWGPYRTLFLRALQSTPLEHYMYIYIYVYMYVCIYIFSAGRVIIIIVRAAS